MIKTKLRSSKQFKKELDKIVHDKRLGYFEAVMYFCEKQKIEPENVKGLINGELKEIIEIECRVLNLLTREEN